LFGLWKGAQNPPEFFIRYSSGAVMDLKELRGPTSYVISQIPRFRFSLFIRKMYLKRRGVRWMTNFCRRCILHQKKVR
jgi:hypothetical protein